MFITKEKTQFKKTQYYQITRGIPYGRKQDQEASRVPAIGVHAQLGGHVSPPLGCELLSFKSVSQNLAYRRHSANNHGWWVGSEPTANTQGKKAQQVKAKL